MTEEELKRKIRVRGGHRASAKRIIAAAEESLQVFDPNNPETVIKVKQQLTTLKEKIKTLSVHDEEILSLVKEEEIENEIEQADIFKERLQHSIVSIEMALEKIVNETLAHGSTVSGTSPSSSNVSQNSSYSATVKLPKLSLKKFSGDVTKWTTFWECYESAIHNNANLTKIEKFNYLKSLLEHSAAKTIEGLQLTNANYDEAIKILKDRFGNQQIIINSHMEALCNIPNVGSIDNVKMLRQLYDKVETHVRSLTSLGVNSGSYGNLMISILMNKLPQAMRVIVTKALGSTWALDKMLNTVKSELEARERANMLSSKPASKPPCSPHPRGYSSAAALLNNGTPPTCTYCKNTHPSAHCNVVTNPNARKQILQREGRCYICLRKNHVSRGCTSSLKCYHCGKRHHASICNARPSRNENEKETHNVDHEGTKSPKDQKSNDTPDNKKTKNNTPDNKQTSHEERKSHSLYIENGTSILLQTAQAEAYKSDAPETSIPV